MEYQEKKLPSKAPSVSLLVPAYNEQENILGCLNSLKNLDYNPKKLQIIVVNDGSTDRTAEIVKGFSRGNKFDVKLVDRKNNSGKKALALNEGLKSVNGEYVGCLDADSLVEKDSLKKAISLFEDDVGAVISVIKVGNTSNIYGKVQRLEYILSNFIRKMMSKIDTLHITPGVLSLYKTKVLKKVGGFDSENITEDLEIAFRLRYNGYKVKMCFDSITTTEVPDTFLGVWGQRVRWFRGFIYNNLKYKNMFMNKKYGLMGTFQYPVNILSVLMILTVFALIVYELFSNIHSLLVKLFVIQIDFFNLFRIPTFKEFLFSINLNITFPILIGLCLALFIYYTAHRTMKEPIRHPGAILTYLTVYPFIRTLHWVVAFTKEVKGSKKKW